MTMGKNGAPDRFDEDRRGGRGFRADHRRGRGVGLGRDLAKLAFLLGLPMGRGFVMVMGLARESEETEKVQQESPQEQPAGLYREMTDAAHTRREYKLTFPPWPCRDP